MKISSYLKTNWKDIIEDYLKNNLPNLENFINAEYSNSEVFPKYDKIFHCFNFFNFEETKVVILGQDPYHNENEAMGLSFSVKNYIRTPSSLRNIFKELENDLNIKRTNNDLSDWAEQGVLLLNSILTVKKNEPLSHSNIGWEKLTDYIIEYISRNNPEVVFLLMGNFARKKSSLIENKNSIIEVAHPSGLSAHRGFFCSRIFSRINEILKKRKIKEINW